MKFYGDTDDANTESAGKVSLGGTDPFAGLGGGGHQSAPKGNEDVGKGSFDFGNFLGSIGQTAQNFAGVVGQIGVPGGPNLGGVVAAPLQAAGAALGAVGGISLPYLGNDPNKPAATLGDVPGLVGDVISAPERFVETEAAKARLRARGDERYVGMSQAEAAASYGIPPDIQARLDAGESVDALAEEMAKEGRGFSNNGVANFVASFVLDPTNLLTFGAGKAVSVARNADRALQAGKEIGVSERFMGQAYAAASKGLSAGGAAIMDKMLGPATSGVFHALGTRPYFALRDGAARLSRGYAQAFEDAFAHGAAQLPRAVLQNEFGDEAAGIVKRYGADALQRVRGGDAGEAIEVALSARRTVNASQIERRTEELLSRVTPDFAGHTDEGRFIETRDKYAHITGMSPEDAAGVLGGKADLRTAQQVHLAFYGKAGDDLARAKTLAAGAKNIDPERLTIIGDNTLTAERAADILSGKSDLLSAVDQYSSLRARFGNTAFDHAKVRAYIERLVKEDVLPHTVKDPVTGKNALPRSLQDWKRTYEPFGYQIGFAPKDGVKVILDEAGEVISSDPFIHFVSEAEPLTYRNPLGRFMDSLFRGATQTAIISDSRARMVQLTRKAGLSANEARAVHQKVLQAAADVGTAPRGLALQGPDVFRNIFRETLGDARYAEFAQKMDPDFAVMKALEGNWQRVGLTQKFTGRVKTAFSGRGNVVSAIAEGIYPKLRFSMSPLFQVQELTESPFLNLLRGVRGRIVDPDVQKVYEELSDLPDFKYLSEAGYVLNIVGDKAAATKFVGEQSLLGKALSRFPNVKAFKERQRVAQVMFEHGPAFEEAVNEINPKLWRTMTEAYGTTDARLIADSFIRERMALTSGSLDEAMATFDAARGSFEQAIQKAYDLGDFASGQALNVQAGIARGANGAGGAMKLTDAELARLGNVPFRSVPIKTVSLEAMGAVGARALLRDGRIHLPADIAGRLVGRPDRIEELRGTIAHEIGHVFGEEAKNAHGAAAMRPLQKLVPESRLRPDQAAESYANIFRDYVVAPSSLTPDELALMVKDMTPERRAFVEALRTGNPSDWLRAGRISPTSSATRPLSHDMETVWQAFRESFRQTSEQAFKTHYFNPTRGFLERSINHPYLGLYPASYMWGKVLPEFARFMLKRPFGLNAPLLGLSAYNRVQQGVIAGLANDPELRAWVEKSNDKGVLYLIDQLLPATPANLPVNLPAWARHAVRDKPKDIPAFVEGESADALKNATGPVKSLNTTTDALRDLSDIAGDIFSNLTKTANELDAQFPR